MKIFFTVSVSIFLLLPALAKPGGTYALTGREKSVFAIYQADMKAFPDLYKGVDINEYYAEFKDVNNLNSGRKLMRGEKLMFPHTPKSKELEEAAKEEVARLERKAEAAARRQARKEANSLAEETTGADTGMEPVDNGILFGSDRRASNSTADPEEIERAREEAARKSARYRALSYFEKTLLPRWMENQSSEVVSNGSIDTLVELAQEKVDEDFSNALKLHRYADKNIYILECAKPRHVGELYFFAIRMEKGTLPYFYSLEKGISFFGAGDMGILREWRAGLEYADLGGRKYDDLAGFLKELEAGRPVKSAPGEE